MANNENSVSETKIMLEEWKQVIETQMHFNDMIMRLRTTVVSIVLAFFGAASFSLQYTKLYLNFRIFSFHVSVLIIISGLVLLSAVFVLDYFYYYRMLLGAVERGYQIDEAYEKKLVDGVKIFGLSTQIRKKVGKPHASKCVVWTFYGLVFAFGIIFIVGVVLGYAPP
jgi:uncharacterized membrane protein